MENHQTLPANMIIGSISEHYISSLHHIEKTSNPHSWTEKNITDAFHQYAHLGLFIDNTLIAFVFYSTVIDETEIIHIVCDTNHQGKGYALLLLTALHKKLTNEEVKTIFLEVRKDNYKAKKLYTKLNYQQIGMRKNYYGHNQDAVLMSLQLSQ